MKNNYCYGYHKNDRSGFAIKTRGVNAPAASVRSDDRGRKDSKNKKLGGLMVQAKTNLRLLLVIGAAVLFSSSTLFAQTTGDYRSAATGNWSAVSTWQMYNGTAWATAASIPPNTANITISAGNTVTVDIADSTSGTLVIDGYLKDVAGFKAKGTTTVNDGATYELAHDGSSTLPGIPTATWNTGSTCLITGNNGSVSSTSGFNASQNFYNFTVNAAFTKNLNFGMDTVRIGGNVVVNNTGSSRVYLTAPTSKGPRVITLIGNLYLTAGQFSTNGSGSSGTIIVNDSGNVIVTGGNFSISRGSGPTVAWNFYGDSLSISNAAVQTTYGPSDSLIFGKQGNQYLTLSKVTYNGGGIPFVVSKGATLNMGYSVFGGEGKFELDSGAVLATENAGGIDSTIQNSGTVTYSTGASFEFNSNGTQYTGSKLPAEIRNLIINNTAGVILSKPVNVTDTLMLMHGQLMLDTNYIMAAAVSGASSSNFVVTDSAQSSYKIPGVGATQAMFPVGTSAEGYSPVWMTNSGTVDTFSVSAKMDTTMAAGLGRVNVRWNIAESHSGANCTLTFGWTHSAENSLFSGYREAYAYIYNVSGTSYTQAGSGSYTTQFSSSPYTLSRGGMSTFGSFVVGKFVVNLLAQMGDYGTVKSGNWDSLSTWKQWNGTAWATTPSVVPENVVNVFINKGDTVTVTGADSVGGTLVVDGYIMDKVGLKTGGTVVFDSASTFDLAHDGPPKDSGLHIPGIPTAIWKIGSTCLITGKNDTVSSTTGFNASQNFYNFIINATFSTNLDLAMYNNTISGMFVVNSNSTKQVRMTSPSAGSPNTITLRGPLYVKDGDFTSNGSGSSADITVNDYGNIYVTGGNFSISRGSGPTVNWNFYGDSLSMSNAQTQTSGSNDAFVFAKQGTQYIALKNFTFASSGMPVLVGNGTTLDMGTNSWGGKAMFATDSGATLISRDTTGLDGNLQSSVQAALSPNGTYVFAGAVAQTTGKTLPSTVGNLMIGNSKGVTLSHNLTVTKALTLTSGKLLLDTCYVTAGSVTGASSTSFVETDSSKSYLGIPKVASTAVMFPVGTNAEGYSPVWITNGGTSDSYTVNAAKDTAQTAEVGRVNVKWNIGEGTPGGSNLTLQFGWMASAENSSFASNRSSDAKIYMDTTEAGSGAYTTQFTTQPYTVSRSGIDTVGTFVVGNFTVTGIEQGNNVPAVFRLYQNYPNPFNPSTKIEFTVAKKGMTSITIYNVLGQKVGTIFSGEALPGKLYRVQFDAASLASGVYFSVLRSNSERQIKKMMLLK